MLLSAQTKLSRHSASSYKSFDVVQLKQLDSSGSGSLTDSCSKNPDDSSHNAPLLLYALPGIFAAGVTVALVLHIFLCESLVSRRGVVVSDHERCTAVGQKVFGDGGSSVDAAIASMLCVGVVHPHASGVGGGGVMLVHDIRRNRTRVIDFRGSAPRGFKEKLLRNVSELEAGLQVAVPGVLMGLHHAHRLYGRLPWEDVVSRAADVARGGFTVSHSLAAAIAQVKGERLSRRFMEVFIPHGRALGPGAFVTMPALAEVLDSGLIQFYHGNTSQEIEDEVRANGGVLSREDVSNYSTVDRAPREEHHDEFIIQVPPPPSAGAVFISALKLLERLHFKEIPQRQSPPRSPEALTGSVAAGLDGRPSSSSLTERLSLLLSQGQEVLNASSASPSNASLQAEQNCGQVLVMGSDDLIVSVASSLSRTFGSRLVTQSGVILNSFLLDVFVLNNNNNNNNTEAPTKQEVRGEVESPVSFLTPTVLVPSGKRCGLYLVLTSSAVHNYLRVITEILSSAVLVHKDNTAFSEGLLQFLHKNGTRVPDGKGSSSVWGLLRKEDVFSVIEGRRLMSSLIVSLSS